MSDRSGWLGPAARGIRVAHVHRVAAPGEDGLEQTSDEPAAQHEHLAGRNTVGSSQDAGERLGVGADRVVDAVRKVHPAAQRHDALGEATRLNCRRAELHARGFVPAQAALAFAAGLVVDERDAFPVRLRYDLVPEHRALGRATDLLDVASAEPAGEHAEDVWPVGLGDFSLLRGSRGIEDDCPHRGVS